MLITYGTALQDKKQICKPNEWDAIITDESHKYRNRQSKTFKLVKGCESTFGLWITGSIYRSQVLDVWPLLHVSNKRVFSSFWKFAHTYVHVIEGFYGKEFSGPRNMENFRKMMDKRAINIHPDQVAAELPGLNRVPLEVEMEDGQRKLYERIWDDLIVGLDNGGLLISQNEMVQALRARQCLACPGILDDSLGVGAAFKGVVEHGEQDPHYIVFTPFAKALPYYVDYLTSQGYEDVYVIQGGMDPQKQGEVVQEFQRTRGILLCTIGVAESWEALTCYQSYFVGRDWSPDVNEQAEDRIRRVSSEHSWVNVHYVKYPGTYDEDVYEAVVIKQQNVKPALASPEEFQRMIRND
jgi:SNF2 family DNA or RNA helicase